MFGFCVKCTNHVIHNPEYLVVTEPLGNFQKTFYGNRTEPKHLAWQWAIKDSPDIHHCSKTIFKSKQYPKKRSFSRFKKMYTRKDIISFDESVIKKKKRSWKEFLQFLLPDEINQNPQFVTCRKLLEVQKNKYIDNLLKYYGQPVARNERLVSPEPLERPRSRICPPPEHIVPHIAITKSAVPSKTTPCFQHCAYKIPFSDIKGGEVEGTKHYIVKCKYKRVDDMPLVNDKSAKLHCKTYGECKGVECPKTMFTRFMSVDLPGGIFRPVVVSEHKLQQEKTKSMCQSSTLSSSTSIRKYHTFTVLWNAKKDFASEYSLYQEASSFLQPNCRIVPVEKMAKRAGFDLSKSMEIDKILVNVPSRNIINEKVLREKMTDKKEEKLKTSFRNVKTPDTKFRRGKKLKKKDKQKTPLQILIERVAERQKKLEAFEQESSSFVCKAEADYPNQTKQIRSSENFIHLGDDKPLEKIDQIIEESAKINKASILNNFEQKYGAPSRQVKKYPKEKKGNPHISFLKDPGIHKRKEANDKLANKYLNKTLTFSHNTSNTQPNESAVARFYNLMKRKKKEKIIENYKRYHTYSSLWSLYLAKSQEAAENCSDGDNKPKVKESTPKPVTVEKKIKCVEKKKKISVHNIKRESCYPTIPKKNKGFICSIARFFGIGCGKRDCK